MSDETPMRRELHEWLRDAYADAAAGCPPPEAYLAAELAALQPEERHRLDAHADACPACSAERELARAFDAGEAGVSAEDVDWVTARLRGETDVAAPPAAANAPPGMPPAGRVVSFRGRAAARTWVRFAAAAVLVVAAGLTVRTFYQRPPALPAPPHGGVVRGGEVEVVAPIGEVAAPPVELRWRPLAGASTYRVRLLAVDGTVLCDIQADGSPAPLPADVTAKLRRAVSYEWTVDAATASGAVIGRSVPARFRIRPLPETDGTEGLQ